MDPREKLRALKATQLEELDRLDALYEKDDLTEEDEKIVDGLEASTKAREAEIAEAEAAVKRREEAAARRAKLGAFDRQTSRASSPPKEPATLKKDDPACGFSTPREFMSALVDFYSEGRMDGRLKHLQASAGSDEHGTYSDKHGGFLVPEAFSPQIKSIDPEKDPTAGRTTTVPMTGPSFSIAARTDKDHTSSVSGGLAVYRRAEAGTVESSRLGLEKVKLEAHSLMGVAYETDELMQDSPVSFAALLASGFSDEFASRILKEKLRGTGSGEMEGILNCPALVTVEKESGQSNGTLVAENIIKMRSRCWGYNNAIWIANHDTYPQLAQAAIVVADGAGAGGLVTVYQHSLQEDRPDMLLGRPIFYSEYASTLGQVGDIMLCNWREYLEGQYQGMRQQQSIHVRFLENERTFKFDMRNDGRSWWRSALTPHKSSSTLSPFVTLAKRAS